MIKDCPKLFQSLSCLTLDISVGQPQLSLGQMWFLVLVLGEILQESASPTV